jgi:hypothetical protein
MAALARILVGPSWTSAAVQITAAAEMYPGRVCEHVADIDRFR